MERQRSVTYITGYIRPKYTATQTAKKLVEIAKSQVGITESPANSNCVKYNDWYWGKGTRGDAYPWCCAFVSWCFAVLAGDITDTSGGTVVPVRTLITVNGCLLKKGSCGQGVITLQAALNARGYSCGTVDGDFGSKTEAAVKKYQAANSLTADGEVGSLTWAKLLV